VLTFTLQVVTAVLILATAVMALRIPAGHGTVFFDAAWKLTGVAFLLHAIDIVAQNAFGGMALAAGTHSGVMSAYLRVAPLFNHSRTFLLDGYFAALVVLALYPRSPDARFWRVATALLVLGFSAGVGLGWGEGSLLESVHYSTVAIWDVVELMVLMVSLFIVLLRDRADRLLWLFWTGYGLSLALGIFWFSVLSQLRAEHAWTPPAWTISAQRIVFYSIMLVAAVRRGRDARAGVPARGMFGPTVVAVRTSLMH
jgi:uncharacterized membrane protein